jgi:hypothetical protein
MFYNRLIQTSGMLVRPRYPATELRLPQGACAILMIPMMSDSSNIQRKKQVEAKDGEGRQYDLTYASITF